MHAHTSASVFYRASVVDAATGLEVTALPRKKNLILDAGLDRVHQTRWTDLINYAAAGSGSTPTRRDSGAVTFSRIGNIVTASAGFFEAQDVGRLLKLASGEELRISAFTSATQVQTTTSGTLAAAIGTIWYVNQTGLVTELRRTNTYGNAGGDNAITLNTAAGTLTQKRTFIFPAETALVTYREVGWSDTSVPGANLFGRDVLAGAGLTLVSGQQLKVVLELVLALELLTPETASFLAWSGGTAEQAIENIDYTGIFNPSRVQGGSVSVFLSTGSDLFIPPRLVGGDFSPNPPGALSGVHYLVNSTSSAYVAGSYERNFSGFFTLNDGNSAAIRSAGWGYTYFSGLYPLLRVRYSANQTKTSDQSLRLDFRHTWGRVLVN